MTNDKRTVEEIANGCIEKWTERPGRVHIKLFDKLRNAIIEALTAERRRADEWEKKYKDLDRSLMAELRDPSGTIWEYAKSLQDKNDALEARLQEAESTAETIRNYRRKDQETIKELEKEVERLRKYEPVEPFIVVDGKKIPYSPDEVSRLREELKCWENDSGLTKELRFKELESELAKRNALIEELKLEIERIEKEKHERMDAFVEAMKKVEDFKSGASNWRNLADQYLIDCQRLELRLQDAENTVKLRYKELEEAIYENKILQSRLQEADKFCEIFKKSQIEFEKTIKELEKEVERLKAEIEGAPRVKTSLPDEFQRLWSDCVTLAEKASFKSVIKYVEKIEARLAEKDKLIEWHKQDTHDAMEWKRELEAELSRHKAALKESKSQAEAIKEANSTGVKNGLAGGIIKIVDDTLASEPLTLPSGDEKER